MSEEEQSRDERGFAGSSLSGARCLALPEEATVCVGGQDLSGARCLALPERAPVYVDGQGRDERGGAGPR